MCVEVCAQLKDTHAQLIVIDALGLTRFHPRLYTAIRRQKIVKLTGVVNHFNFLISALGEALITFNLPHHLGSKLLTISLKHVASYINFVYAFLYL